MSCRMSTYQDLQAEVDRTFDGIRTQKRRFAQILNSVREILIKEHGVPEENAWFELPKSENSNIHFPDAMNALQISSTSNNVVRLIIQTAGREGFIKVETP